jgi:hypothetical protein
VKLADPNDYYADTAVEHTAQGDTRPEDRI